MWLKRPARGIEGLIWSTSIITVILLFYILSELQQQYHKSSSYILHKRGGYNEG